jgi:hypothetical protein
MARLETPTRSIFPSRSASDSEDAGWRDVV